MARIPHAVLAEQLDQIAAILDEHPRGLSPRDVGALYAQRYPRLPSRTLRRRLEQLEAQGRAEGEGTTGDRFYRSSPHANTMDEPGPATHREGRPGTLLPPWREATPAARKTAPAPGYVPLTAEATEVWALMQRPMVEREPVGYDRRFLEAYAPGESWYLPLPLRTRLHELGRAPDPGRPAGTYARDILGRLLIDLAWASSRLEGNTYSRIDTQNLIEFGQRAEGADPAEAQMILNHKAAIEYLVDCAETVAFDRPTLTALHALLSENLLESARDEGRLRIHPVGITGTSYTPLGSAPAIEDCFGLLLEKAAAIPDPFEQAFFAMVHIPYLQPFADVNKRTSRLGANIPLIRSNRCPLSFVDVPERAYLDGTLAIYELARVELLRDIFEWAYERSCKQYRVIRDSLGQPDPLRLRYREELADVVRETVLSGLPPQRRNLRAWGEQKGIAEEDLDGFAERALDILLNLHEGAAGRYRLRPSQFQAWRASLAPGETG